MRNLRILCAFMGIIGITGADEQLLTGGSLASFTAGFRLSLVDVVRGAYEVALDDMAELQGDFDFCRIAIEDEQSNCERCVNDKCKPGILGSVVNFVSDIGNVLHGVSFNDIDVNIDVDLGLRNVGAQVGHATNVLALSRKRRSSDRELLRSELRRRGWFNSVVHVVEDVVDVVVDTLLGDADCMNECDSCDAFQGDTTFLINAVCGVDLLNRNATLAADVEKIQFVVGAVSDNVQLIVVQVTIDGVYDSGAMSLPDMIVVAKFRLGERAFSSQYPYRLMLPEDTGRLCGVEYWWKYDEYD